MRLRFIKVLAVVAVLTAAFSGIARALDFNDEDTPPPPGEVGAVYYFKVAAHAGCLPYHFVVDSGELPPGLTLSDLDSSNDSFDGWEATSDLEARFDTNVSLVDDSRVRKFVGKTRKVLPRLLDAEERFEIIYIDASHLALDVLVDAALAWQLLDPGGIVIFDDYGLDYADPLLSPTRAIDAFLEVVSERAAPPSEPATRRAQDSGVAIRRRA